MTFNSSKISSLIDIVKSKSAWIVVDVLFVTRYIAIPRTPKSAILKKHFPSYLYQVTQNVSKQ